jgi:hypothetical protein
MAVRSNGTTITPPRVPLIDARTGQIDRVWYLFFYDLFNLSGANTTDLSALQIGPSASVEPVVDSLALQAPTSSDSAALVEIRSLVEGLSQAPPVLKDVVSAFLVPPSTITPTGSPFTYQNVTTFPADVVVQGGTVSKIEFSRDGTTWIDVGVIAGMFGLSSADNLRVTYTVAPTMTLIPR